MNDDKFYNPNFVMGAKLIHHEFVNNHLIAEYQKIVGNADSILPTNFDYSYKLKGDLYKSYLFDYNLNTLDIKLIDMNITDLKFLSIDNTGYDAKSSLVFTGVRYNNGVLEDFENTYFSDSDFTDVKQLEYLNYSNFLSGSLLKDNNDYELIKIHKFPSFYEDIIFDPITLNPITKYNTIKRMTAIHIFIRRKITE